MMHRRRKSSTNQAQAHFRFQPALVLRMLSLVLLISIGMLLLGCGVGATGGRNSLLNQQQAQASTALVGSRFFGMVVQSAGVSPAVAVGSRRLWDASVTWAALEPAHGVFAWQALDAEVAAAAQQGQQAVLTLGMVPAWASSEPALASPYGSGATVMPAQMADWDSYVTAVAQRYSGRISAYEVWNAPEDPGSWSGAPDTIGADMAELAAHAAASIHAADPSAQVVAPAFTASGMAQFLAAGGGALVDAVATRLNISGAAPEASLPALQAFRAVLVGSAVANKAVWNEQSAWVLPSGGLSAQSQAAWVARALLLNTGYGIARMHWYAWDDTQAGVISLSNSLHQPAEAALAYATVENWLAGNSVNGCSASAEGVWSCQIIADGKTAWAVWSPNQTTDTSTLGAATETDVTGRVTQISGVQSVQIGESPVLLQ